MLTFDIESKNLKQTEMKRNLLTFSMIFLLASIGANAQHRFFITGGLNLAKADIVPAIDADFGKLTGFDGGMGAEFNISKHFAVQPELNYSMQGGKVESNGNALQIKLNYITVPVLAKLMPAEGLGIFLGPQVGFLTSAKSKYSGQKEQNAISELKQIDYMGVFGAEYRFRMGLVIGARYQLGFRNIADIPNSDIEIRNKSLTFRIGYSFPFSGSTKRK
jgi:hypothetical protein